MKKKIEVSGTRFVDGLGRDFVAGGINMVCKEKAKGYLGGWTREDFAFLKKNCFNMIRLGLIWDGAEPEPGCYSTSYFEGIDRLIELAAEADIPVFLDMHQDLYGVVFEDGAPAWATVTDGLKHVRTELWSDSYLLSPAVQHAFDNFWNNVKAQDGVGIRDHYINLWRFIAERYAQNPYVVGYDLMNEPFPGSAGAEVAMIIGEVAGGNLGSLEDPAKIGELITRIAPITARFETATLQPFYEELAENIREVDKNTIIMFESNYFTNAAIPTALSPLKDSLGRVIPAQAYVPHGYDILVDTDAYGTGGFERVGFIIENVFDGINRLSLPALIGEWGCYPGASEGEKAQAAFLLDLFRERKIGNAYFEFSHLKDGGILDTLRQ